MWGCLKRYDEVGGSMETISGNIYATPKCGINFVRACRFNVPDGSKGVWFVRNPYARVVSYYVNKVVYQCFDPRGCDHHGLLEKVSATENRGPLWERCALESSAKEINNWSFAEFVKWLSVQDDATMERHLRTQYRPHENVPRHIEAHNMHIFKIENLSNETNRLSGVFEISEADVIERLDRAYADRSNKTPRTACISEVFDLSPSALRDPVNPNEKYTLQPQGNIPKCMTRYYNDEIADLVYNYYEKDFKLAGYDRNSYKKGCTCSETTI
jgi:hypothetical protein